MRISVVGLGKLGLPFAEILALRHEVSGFDLAERASETVRIAPSLADACADAELVLVVLPTPHEAAYDGSAPTTHLPARDFAYALVAETLGAADAASTGGTELAVVSTVLPGTVRRELAPRVTRCELLYAPAFMAMGRIRQDFLEPEFRLLGTDTGDHGGGRAMQELWLSFGGDAPVHLVTWEEAEAVKIVYNVFISFKIAFANTVQDVAERIGHIDADAVVAALSDATDRLLSKQYLKPGMGDGGPCHPRDLIAMRYLAAELDLGYDLFGVIAAAREAQARRLAERLVSFDLPVLLTSRAYKPEVPYEDGSSALLVSSYVHAAGQEVRFLGNGVPDEPHAVLIVHDVDHQGVDFPAGSVIVDPWRRYTSDLHQVVHYGSTRP
jgi:UDPglucose 6-dehydrogenase